ncbi:MAG: DUF1931 family protein [Deltaproteobacteria bacterium]|nr:MAG: DUF1931 family protein [Deltaproteobacteria bacterium]
MIMGYERLKEFLRRSSGLNIDKSDTKQLTELIGNKLNDLLVIGVRNASYNDRDIVMEPDLPLTKGFLEHMQEFRSYDEQLELKPILDQLATYPPLERSLSADVEAMLPELAGTLAMLAGHAMKILDPDVKNPDDLMWEKVVCLMDLLL